MKGKKFSLLRILTVGAACALTSIFLFCGCSAKPAKSQAPDGADAYGVYTNLTLSLDCGEGKVWASVKNTFTLMPSKVRVLVELYASEDYKPSYKEMSLVSENAVTDLNMGDSVTAEATTNGKEMFWQARAYYKVDEKDWQERTTKIWQIKGNGNIVTTNAQPPKTEELPAEPFRLTDVIDGEPIGLNYMRFRTNEPVPDIVVDDDGTIHMPIFMLAGLGNTDDKVITDKLFDYFADIIFEPNANITNRDGSKYFLSFYLDNGKCLDLTVNLLGKIFCQLISAEGKPELTFATENYVIDIEALKDFVEKYIEEHLN